MTTQTARAITAQQRKPPRGRPRRRCARKAPQRAGMADDPAGGDPRRRRARDPDRRGRLPQMTSGTASRPPGSAPRPTHTTFSDPTFWRVMENNALLLLCDPVRGPVSAGDRLPVEREGSRLAVLPHDVLPADRGLLGRDRHGRGAVLRSRRHPQRSLSAPRARASSTPTCSPTSTRRCSRLASPSSGRWSGTNMIIFLAGIATIDPAL